MKNKLEWLSEEEGCLTFFEEEQKILSAQVYLTGEEEAEFNLKEIAFLQTEETDEEEGKELFNKTVKCLSEAFRLLWEEGFEETTLVERQDTKIACFLDSTDVVNVEYKEYMMKCSLIQQECASENRVDLVMKETEEGYVCENPEKTFFCRLMNYEAEQSGEKCFYLYEVEVAKQKRNKGIATACLKELFQRLQEQSAVTVYLQVGSYNEPAVHLYEKLGFTISEALCYYTLAE